MDLLKELLAEAVPREGTQDDLTPDPAKLAEQAKQPATVAAVNRAFVIHREKCSALRWIRYATLALAFVLGMQVVVMIAGRSMLRETIREAVRAELGAQEAKRATASTDVGVLFGSAHAAEAEAARISLP